MEVTLPLRISSTDPEGWGLSQHSDGKTVLVAGALPQELVEVALIKRRKLVDEAQLSAVLEPHPQREQPPCAVFGRCGGCQLQHASLALEAEIKRHHVLKTLERIARVTPQRCLPEIKAEAWSYRRRARLSVRHVRHKGRTLVGFREHHSHFVVDMDFCHVLEPRLAALLPALSQWLNQLSQPPQVPQIEMAAGDDSVSLVLRLLAPLPPADEAQLIGWIEQWPQPIRLFFQPQGPESLKLVSGHDQPPLLYRAAGLSFHFGPLDFTQVHAGVNALLIAQVLAWLEVEPGDKVADFFCGLGNFSLPMAQAGAQVQGFELDLSLLKRAAANARLNHLEQRTSWHQANLFEPKLDELGYRLAVVDPPRSGAEALMGLIGHSAIERLVYVSCNPDTLARDLGLLVHQHGFKLSQLALAQMFSRTSHIETLCLLER